MKKSVQTYSELRDWFRLFNQHRLELLIVDSLPGQGKSTLAKECVENYCLIEGRITSAALYDQIYQAENRLIIIDDIDDIYKDKLSVNILKCLCQTETEKRLSWYTRTQANRIAPMEFTTTSKTAILTNTWKTLNAHVGAIEDRGILLYFSPSAHEVHKHIQKIGILQSGIVDKEVYDFIGSHLHLVHSPSIRYYLNASRIKVAGLDWIAVLFESIGMDADVIIAIKCRLLDGLPEKEKAKMFARQTGKSERTYYRIISRYSLRG